MQSPQSQCLGIVVVDHGSRRAESNQCLLDVVASFRGASGCRIVEPAHMELAEPSLGTAFDRCVAQGANRVIIHPFFLLPGRHWSEDIPALAAAAARRHAGVQYLVTAPLGLHRLISQVIAEQVAHCLNHAEGGRPPCDACAGAKGCQWRPASPESPAVLSCNRPARLIE